MHKSFRAQEVVVDAEAEEDHIAHCGRDGAVNARGDEDERGDIQPVAVPGHVPQPLVGFGARVDVVFRGEEVEDVGDFVGGAVGDAEE